MSKSLDDVVRAIASLRSMSPEDAYQWFDAPIVTFFIPVIAPGTQLCGVNPRRVALLIDSPSSGSTLFISPTKALSATQGLVVQPARQLLIFTQHDHGPLAQCDWYVSSTSGGASAIVIEVVLREWPSERVQGE